MIQKSLSIILLIIAVEMVAFGAQAIDPDKPLYQFDWGGPPPGHCTFFGGMSERQHPKPVISPEEKQLRIRLENIGQAAQRGRKMISRGLSAIVLGVMLTFFLKQFHLQSVGLCVSGYGIWQFAAGILEIKLAENWKVATGAAAVGIILIIAAVMLWPRGIDLNLTKLIKRLKPRQEGNG